MDVVLVDLVKMVFGKKVEKEEEEEKEKEKDKPGRFMSSTLFNAREVVDMFFFFFFDIPSFFFVSLGRVVVCLLFVNVL